MEQKSISERIRTRIRQDIATPGYSGSSSDGGLASGIRSTMAETRRNLEEVSSQSTENRAGWIATISDIFGFGDEDVETPSSTYDEGPATAYTPPSETYLDTSTNFDYNSVAGISAMSDDSFTRSAEQVAANLNIPVNWMYAVIDTESGFDPQIRNQAYVQQGREEDAAIGIIQFMPATAEALGTSVEELRTMSRTEQLTYVERFYEQYADKIQSPEDLYVATFYPRALGEEDDFVLGSERSQAVVSNIVEGNRAIDANNDGQITLGEVKQFYRNSRGFNRFVAPFQET